MEKSELYSILVKNDFGMVEFELNQEQLDRYDLEYQGAIITESEFIQWCKLNNFRSNKIKND